MRALCMHIYVFTHTHTYIDVCIDDITTVDFFFTLQPCKKVCQHDVDLMYTELIQRCKIMYLTESDGDDEDSFYQLPSFLDSIASILIHLDKVAYHNIIYYNRHDCTVSPLSSSLCLLPFFLSFFPDSRGVYTSSGASSCGAV